MSNTLTCLLKENFKITNDCLILVIPLVIFVTLLQFYIENFQYRLSNYANYFSYYAVLWVILSAFCSGWFYMVKKTMQFSKKIYLLEIDRISALKTLFLCLFKGVGRFFPNFLVITALIIIFMIIKSFAMINLYNSPLKPSYESLTRISFIIELIGAYIFMYIVPEVVYSYKNIFTCIFNCIKKLLISFRQSLLLFGFICLICAVFHFIMVNTIAYPIIYFFELLFTYYTILYIVLLIFRYYEKNYTEE